MLGRLIFAKLGLAADVIFLVDTGADCTSIHPRDAIRLRIPYQNLTGEIPIEGLDGKRIVYFSEEGYLLFAEGNSMIRGYTNPRCYCTLADVT